MSFGGGSDSANREIIEFQKEEAAKAEAKEAERQARLQRGRELISAIFEGGSVVPEGFNLNAMSGIMNPEWEAYMDAMRDRPSNGGWSRTDGGWLNRSERPEGGRYLTNEQAIELGLMEDPRKTYSGIGQDFYDTYRSALDDFYYPELERQYGEAKSQNLFDLARKGLLRSSEAADRAGELARDYAENRAQIGSQIEGQVTGLQDSVNRSRRNSLNLLTSTEDPTSAANQALTEVNAVRTQKPQFNDLGNLFADVLNTFGIAQQAARQREYLNSIPTRGAYESSGSYYA